MDIEKVKSGLKLLDQGMRQLGAGPMDFYANRLVECYEFLLTLAPHKVGDRVRLVDAPPINERDSWGWMHAKHFIVKGAIAVVAWVEADGEGFSYFLQFDDDSWINTHTKAINPRPPTDRGTYGLRGKWLEGCHHNGP